MSTLIGWFDERFTQLYRDWRELTQEIKLEDLYRKPITGSQAQMVSLGEQIVRSARAVEQTFGGITANLWDDPFEWTLPETLSTSEKLIAYFDEVEATRQRAFRLFKTDEDLFKEVMTPAGATQLLNLLLDTLVRARASQQTAKQTVEIKSDHGDTTQFAANLS